MAEQGSIFKMDQIWPVQSTNYVKMEPTEMNKPVFHPFLPQGITYNYFPNPYGVPPQPLPRFYQPGSEEMRQQQQLSQQDVKPQLKEYQVMPVNDENVPQLEEL